MLERSSEDALRREAKRRRVWSIKAERLCRGFPDRMLLAHGGRIAFAELKRPGQGLRPAQHLVVKWLRHLGFLVVKLDHPDDVKEFFSEWLD